MASACAAHTVMETGLACGRCERAICGTCIVHTAVGGRCRECSAPSSTRQVRADSLPVNRARWQSSQAGAMQQIALAVGAAFFGYLIYAWLRGDYDGVIIKLIVFGGWVFSVSLHEFAHGLVAYLGGDRDIKRRGLLTLNPLKFMDPLFTVIMPVVFVLLGGAPLMGGVTHVHSDSLRGKWWDSAVSFAGPAANVLFALTLALVLRVCLGLAVFDEWSPVQRGWATWRHCRSARRCST